MPRKTVITPGPRDEKGVLSARILGVAREAFAENGWAGTTIRGVARSADVDPALVYHYFKSKELLLDACTTLPPEFLARIPQQNGSTDSFGVSVVQGMLASWRDEALRPVLRAILLIAAHEARTLEKLKSDVAGMLAPPVTTGRTEKKRLTRSGLIASQTIGFSFMRYIWQIEPLASMTDDEVIAALAPTLQHYADGEIEPTKKTRQPRPTAKPALAN